jgi:hypothetical protein
MKPVIVCLCGSTRFSDAFRKANFDETLAWKIVLSVGCDFKSDEALGLTQADKNRLDELHLEKINLADEILVLNQGGYVGQSTSREICYANRHGKLVRWLEPVSFDLFEASHQGMCGCCSCPAEWLRFEASRVTAALCDRHAWVNGGAG